MKQAYFFDMDGVLFDSMPNHSQAWDEVMRKYGLDFTARDCYLNEGRTGQDVIANAIWRKEHRQATEEEIWTIYKEKTARFHTLGGALPMKGVKEVIEWLQAQGKMLYVVTGSGQKSMFTMLEDSFPGVFIRERMVTALDVPYGKPRPEPYLKAWEKTGLAKSECCVIENAPMGIQAGKGAGLFTIAVNTGPLEDDVLWEAGADVVLKNMAQLLEYIKK